MQIAILQMDCVEGDATTNQAVVESAIRTACSNGAHVLALPELWSSGYDLAAATAATADPNHDHTLEWLTDASNEIAILGGSVLEPFESKHRNCAVALEGGRVVQRYRKRHLFRPLDEHRYLEAGVGPPEVFSLAGVEVAFAICYDLRFPELFIPLCDDKVELIAVPAQWPRARIAHWRALLIARAIESQCYVLGINRCGWFGELEFPGHSLLVGPKGDVLVDCGEETGLFYGEIDPAEVRAWRREFPVHADRRSD